MRGYVNRALNERQRPSVNAQILRYYNYSDEVQITRALVGDEYDSEDVWYQLDTGGYVWGGGVDPDRDCEDLPLQDRDQFIISYRKLMRNANTPDINSKEPDDKLHFTPIRLPHYSDTLRLNTIDTQNPAAFVGGVTRAMTELIIPPGKPSRDHVMVYIHGYQILSSLKLDLFAHYVQNYMFHDKNKIAKVLFFTWPAHDLSRKTVDDRSIRAGQFFTARKLFHPLEELSKALRAEGKYLNLVVHSFGHQLLNGMVNPAPLLAGPDKIFENIFLMAPDITHLTVKKGTTPLHNYYQDSAGKSYNYGYENLKILTDNVHVFYDKYDYLLYSSTKKFVGASNINDAEDPWKVTKDYRNLGNYGKDAPRDQNTTAPPDIDVNSLVPGFTYHNVEALAAQLDPRDLIDFPFQHIRNGAGNKVDCAWSKADYSGINLGQLILNMKRFPDHHRYLFTCKPIVEKVQSLLK